MKKTIVIDFDGTLFTDEYPKVGRPKRHAKEVVNTLYSLGHTIVINTCRAGKHEYEAKEALKKHGIKYHCINENPIELICRYGNDCRKLGGDIYIDDKNLGSGFMSWGRIRNKLDIVLNHKPVIICIVGESGTGKTTIAQYLESEHNIPMIRSYTDRAPRYDGEDGHTFVSKEEYDKFDMDDTIANTKFGDNRYCCFKSDVKEYNTYVIDLHGLDMLIKNHSDEYDIYSMRIERPEQMRNVSKERIERDKGVFDNSQFEFDVTILNTWTLESMYDSIDYNISRMLEEYYW